MGKGGHRTFSIISHGTYCKLPENDGCFSGSETFPSRHQGPSCACLDRQHIGGQLHKSSGGLRSCPLYKLAHQILLWAQGKLLSLRKVYVPGHLNQGADILSRQDGGVDLEGCSARWKWSYLHLKKRHCLLRFSLTHPALLGLDAMVPEVVSHWVESSHAKVC